MRNFALYLIAFSLLAISCSKDKDPSPTPGVAGLVAFNLAPDQHHVFVTVDGAYFTAVPLDYSNYSGKYKGVYEGQKSVVSFDQLSNLDLAKVDFNFHDSAYYSLFFLGYKNNYKNLIVEDKILSLPKSTGKSFVRYLFAIPDSLGAHITVGNGTVNFFDENNFYSHISEFKETAQGGINASVKNGSGDIDEQHAFNLEANGIYTIIFQGTSRATDTLQKVKINMIQNGVAK